MASFLIPVLTVLLVVALFVYQRAVGALEDSVMARLEAVAQVKQAALASWIEHLFEDTRLLAALPETRRRAAELVAADGDEQRAREAYRALAAAFGEVVAARPSISELMLLSASGGQVMLSTRSGSQGGYHTHDRFYVEGRARPFVQNVYPSPADLRPTLTISTPLAGVDGNTVAVLAAHHTLGYLDESTLGGLGLGETGRVTLIDRHGNPVTGESYGMPAAGAALRSYALDQLVRGRSGRGTYTDPLGKEVLGVFRWMEGLELGMLLEIERRAALAPTRRWAMVVGAAGLALMALLGAGTYFIARRIASPIQKLAGASLEVAAGDLDARAEVTSGDEIGLLAANFNEMTARLKALYDEMNDQIVRLRLNEQERESLIGELEAKNAELERFAYTVSHDLKSPLVTIRGYVSMIERDLSEGNTERLGQDLPRIAAAAATMTELLEQLLELSRVGHLAGRPEEIDLGALVREVVESLAARLKARDVAIDLDPDLPVVLGDRVRLREVIENLLDNALKFMGDQAHPRIEIGRQQRRGDEAVIYIRDNGAGISVDYHERIFGLFHRLDPEIEGTGIGLALVRRIIETHGGRIWVESDGPGTGSSFYFTLPLRKSS